MAGSQHRTKASLTKSGQEVLALCYRALLHVLRIAAQALLSADDDLLRAMEPVEKALKLLRELSKELSENGGTEVIVETLVPLPPMSGGDGE